MIWSEAMPSSFTAFRAMLPCGRSKSVIFNEHQRSVARRWGITPDGAGQGDSYLSRQTALANSARSSAYIATRRNFHFGTSRSAVARSVKWSLCNAGANFNRLFTRSRHRHAVDDRGLFAVDLQSD